jgi:hypothetical protein
MVAKIVSHKFVTSIADGGDATLLRPSNWNDDHNVWMGRRSVAITTDAITNADHLSLIVYNSLSPVAVSLPAPASGNMPLGWTSTLRNSGAGLVTVTGTGGATINGASSVVLYQNDWLRLYSDVTAAYIGGVTLGSVPISPFGVTNLSLAASVASNVLTIAVKDSAGNDPTPNSNTRISFRNVAAGNGQISVEAVTGPLSISTVVGASLGASANQAFRLWVVAFDSAGVPVLGLFNASTGGAVGAGTNRIYPLAEHVLQNSLAMSAAATAAGTFYTAAALSARPIRILGYVEYGAGGLATPGTYTRVPDQIQIFGHGIYKPGDVIQRIAVSSAPTNTSTAQTFAATTGLSVTLPMTSPANLAAVKCSGTITTNGPGQSAYVQLSRGNTNNTNLIGSTGVFGASGGTGLAPFRVSALDKPNVPGSQVYALQWHGDAAGVNITLYQSAEISAEEIMG